ncbi:MAG: lamin tail domain-containing protein [Chitinispirillaceae bacterium]|nr:lamin tail domain-containing protein [Chitinispirillaceae bacterium]
MLFRHPSIVIASALLLAAPITAQVVITELQRDPAGSETAAPGGLSHEFVEIANLGIDTFRIDSLHLTDGVEADAVVPWPDSLPLHADGITGVSVLAPGQVALVLDPGYPAAVDSVPSSRLPIRPGTVLLRTDDAELGNGLAGDDGILLYKGTRTAVSSVVWCAADAPFDGAVPTAGKIVLGARSPEGRTIVPVSFLFGTIRYAAGVDSLTPGWFDRLNNGWFAEWRFGDLDTLAQAFPCSLACVKSGGVLASTVRWRIELRSPGLSRIAAQGDCAVTRNRGDAACVLPLDSAVYAFCLVDGGVEAEWLLDVSALWTPAAPVKINELYPRANAGEPEWFELVNVSPMPINLENWTFGNSEGADTLSAQALVLQPGACLVVTANLALFKARYPARNAVTQPARWRALDNYNDTLCLWDAKRRLKERVCYRSTWFAAWTTQSLERTRLSAGGMDAASWALAQAPTPGQPNGSSQWRSASVPSLAIGPLPFTPNGDGTNDLLSIVMELPGDASAAVAIYGFSGNKLRSFAQPASGRIFWDGRQDNGSPAPLGPFIVVMETASSSGKVILRKKGVLWR